MRMIRKLGEDKKANCPGHLAEIVHAYNATQSMLWWGTVHINLMFGWRPRLPVDFYFPTFRSTEAPTGEVPLPTVWMSTWQLSVTNWGLPSGKLRPSQQAEAQQQKWYYDQKIGTVNLKPGDLVLVKADAFKGRRKTKDRWEDEHHEVVCPITMDIPSYEVTNQCGQSRILHCNQLLLIASETGVPLCVGVHHVQGQMYQPHPS